MEKNNKNKLLSLNDYKKLKNKEKVIFIHKNIKDDKNDKKP